VYNYHPQRPRVITRKSHLPVIEATELLTRIENGDPLIYDHVVIAGDIDISRLDLPLIGCEKPAKEAHSFRRRQFSAWENSRDLQSSSK